MIQDYDTPLLVENEEPLWIGFEISIDMEILIAGCEASRPLMARQGEILEEEDAAPNQV